MAKRSFKRGRPDEVKGKPGQTCLTVSAGGENGNTNKNKGTNKETKEAVTFLFRDSLFFLTNY